MVLTAKVCRSQTMTLVSSEPVRRYWDSRVTHMHRILPEWPKRKQKKKSVQIDTQSTLYKCISRHLRFQDKLSLKKLFQNKRQFIRIHRSKPLHFIRRSAFIVHRLGCYTMYDLEWRHIATSDYVFVIQTMSSTQNYSLFGWE